MMDQNAEKMVREGLIVALVVTQRGSDGINGKEIARQIILELIDLS